MKASQLKKQFDQISAEMNENQRTRFHRAIRWLERAEKETDDEDIKFIILWIAFNAAYARMFGEETSERVNQRKFFSLLLDIDSDGMLHALLYKEFSGTIRNLINNKYLYEPFWKALRDFDSSNRWKASFANSTGLALMNLMQKETLATLEIIFDRLYALRNQLVHGGSTWNSRTNREQVRNGANLMSMLVPVMISLMLKDPTRDFGEVNYPVV